MAAKKRAKRAPRKKAPTKGTTKVRTVKRDARRLVTIGTDSSYWKDGATVIPDEFKGCIVRVKPPANVSAAVIQGVVDTLRQHAAAVKLLPQERSDSAVVQEKATPVEYTSVRMVVTEMANAVDTSRDKAALASLVGTVMDEERL